MALEIVPPEVRAALNAGTANVYRRLDILNNDYTMWFEDAPMLSGSVEVDISRSERRTATVELDNTPIAEATEGPFHPDPDNLWYDKIFVPYRGVDIGTKEVPDVWSTPLGYFVIDSIESSRIPGKVSVSLRDQTKLLIADKFTNSVSVGGVFTGIKSEQFTEDGGLSTDFSIDCEISHPTWDSQSSTYEAIAGKWIEGSLTESNYILRLRTDGALEFRVSNGTTLQAAAVTEIKGGWDALLAGIESLEKRFIRVTFDSDDGASGTTIVIGVSADGVAYTDITDVGHADEVTTPAMVTFLSNNTPIRLGMGGYTTAALPAWGNSDGNTSDEFVGEIHSVKTYASITVFTGPIVHYDFDLDAFYGNMEGFDSSVSYISWEHGGFRFAEDAMKIIAATAYVDTFAITSRTSISALSATYELGTSRWDAILDLAAFTDQEVFLNRYGQLELRQFADTIGAADFTWFTGAGGNLIDYQPKALDIRLKNHFIVQGEGAGSDKPIVGQAENDDPNSAVSITRIGRRTAEIQTTALATSVGVADSIAYRNLLNAGLETHVVPVTSLVVPWLEVGIVGAIDDPDAPTTLPASFLVGRASIPLTLAPATAELRRVENVSNLVDRTFLDLRAGNYSGTGDWLNAGTGGATHNASFLAGSTFMPHEAKKDYFLFPDIAALNRKYLESTTPWVDETEVSDIPTYDPTYTVEIICESFDADTFGFATIGAAAETGGLQFQASVNALGKLVVSYWDFDTSASPDPQYETFTFADTYDYSQAAFTGIKIEVALGAAGDKLSFWRTANYGLTWDFVELGSGSGTHSWNESTDPLNHVWYSFRVGTADPASTSTALQFRGKVYAAKYWWNSTDNQPITAFDGRVVSDDVVDPAVNSAATGVASFAGTTDTYRWQRNLANKIVFGNSLAPGWEIVDASNGALINQIYFVDRPAFYCDGSTGLCTIPDGGSNDLNMLEGVAAEHDLTVIASFTHSKTTGLAYDNRVLFSKVNSGRTIGYFCEIEDVDLTDIQVRGVHATHSPSALVATSRLVRGAAGISFSPTFGVVPVFTPVTSGQMEDPLPQWYDFEVTGSGAETSVLVVGAHNLTPFGYYEGLMYDVLAWRDDNIPFARIAEALGYLSGPGGLYLGTS